MHGTYFKWHIHSLILQYAVVRRNTEVNVASESDRRPITIAIDLFLALERVENKTHLC